MTRLCGMELWIDQLLLKKPEEEDDQVNLQGLGLAILLIRFNNQDMACLLNLINSCLVDFYT